MRPVLPEIEKVDAWFAGVGADLRNVGGWQELLVQLVGCARFDDAVAGLELAADAELVDLSTFLVVADAISGHGLVELALLVTASAAVRYPRDARVWFYLAGHYLALGDPERATRVQRIGIACERAPVA